MCISPVAIPKVCGSKSGGTVEVYVFSEDDVDSLTFGSTSLDVTALVMKASKYPVKWEFDEDQPSPLKSVKGDNSDAWTITLDFSIPGNRKVVSEQITDMIGGRYGIIAKDGSGNLRLGMYANGDTFKGMKLGAIEESTGDNFEGKPGQKMQFKRISDKPAYYLTGAIPQP